VAVTTPTLTWRERLGRGPRLGGWARADPAGRPYGMRPGARERRRAQRRVVSKYLMALSTEERNAVWIRAAISLGSARSAS